MEQQPMDNPNPFPESPKGRPMFLTVICILTFIGAGFGTLYGIYALATAEITKKAVNLADDMFDKMKDGKPPVPFDIDYLPDSLKGDSLTPEQQAAKDSIQQIWSEGSEEMKKGAEMMENMLGDVGNVLDKTAYYAYELAFAHLAGNLLCLLGAIMMFNLKKIGFYAYLTGHVVAIGVPMVLLGGTGGGLVGGMMTMGYIFMGIFAVGFIIMYGVNLKHMK